jgi:hypothetical protein
VLMKFIIPFLLMGCFALPGCSGSHKNAAEETSDVKTAEPVQVPELVLQKFNSLFPTINNVDWDMEDQNYEATFQHSDGRKSVVFSPNGEVLSSETEINVNSLPEAMTAYIAENLKDKKIEDAEMVITASGGITYEIEIEDKDYIFDGAGKFINIEEENGEDEGDDKD